ncbi:MAG: hypothetical protein ABIQ18_23415 [Umezawaea sp.]
MNHSRIPQPASTGPLLPDERSPFPREFRAALIANAFTGASRARGEQLPAVDQAPADEDTGRHHLRPGAPVVLLWPNNTAADIAQAPAGGAL